MSLRRGFVSSFAGLLAGVLAAPLWATKEVPPGGATPAGVAPMAKEPGQFQKQKDSGRQQKEPGRLHTLPLKVPSLRAPNPAGPGPVKVPMPTPTLDADAPKADEKAKEDAAKDEPAARPFQSPAAEAPNLGELIATGIRAVTQKASPAICRIEAEDEQGRLAGTGFLVDSDGTLITSFSIGNAAEDLVVTVGTEKYPARRLLSDSRSGISLVKIESSEPLPFLKSGKARALTIGAPVIGLGYPLDLPLSPSFGVVAGFDAGFQGRLFATRHIRANAVIQRGEGGAPLLDMEGDVVGVLISSVENGAGLFALPIEAAEKVLHDYRIHGQIRPGWFGADVRITDAPEHGSTARLRAINPKGPAAKLLRAGDVLLKIGEWKITCPEDVLNASFYLTATEPVEVTVSRAGKILTLPLVPADPVEGEGMKVYRRDSEAAGAMSDLQLGK